MIDDPPTPPAVLTAILRATEAHGFEMASDARFGALLRTLAASKPGGAMLELGTGTGVATAWLLDGMDAEATLVTVDADESVVSIARRHLGSDARVTFVVADGAEQLRRFGDEGRRFDLVFADAWAGKFTHLDEALRLVAVSGLYVVDDLLPKPDWPEDHPAKVEGLIGLLQSRSELRVSMLSWSTGILVAAKV